jgi:hypothetical protein
MKHLICQALRLVCLGVFLVQGVEGASDSVATGRLIDFQQYRFGLAPAEFDYDATGPHGLVLSAGRPLWRIYVDLFAPSPKYVLIQSSALPQADHYPIALLRETKGQNLNLRVSFKLLSGNVARSAGVLCRAEDKDNYYAVLADDLKGTLRLLRMDQGQPTEIGKVPARLKGNEWNLLELSVNNEDFKIRLNDREILQARDRKCSSSGRAGLLTQADTTALFDDFYIATMASLPKPLPD